MRMPRTALMLIAGMTLAVSTACGGDDGGGVGVGGGDGGGDGGGGGSALSDEAFCARIEALAEESGAFADEEEADAAFFEGLSELRDSAPNDEVRDAIGTFVDFFEEVQDLDENDPEAFERLLELSSSPDLASAEEVLEDFSVNTCGFDPEE